MATLIKSNGEKQDGYVATTLSEMQGAVGGYIEFIYLPNNSGLNNKVLVVNDEGALKQLPRNVEASQLAGQNIVGDVLLMNQKDID
jgi:hypothetical protein|tara:strand:+ start:602 stop:859 length:258 start_codon:yes stop_codon:yes gene_type:complete